MKSILSGNHGKSFTQTIVLSLVLLGLSAHAATPFQIYGYIIYEAPGGAPRQPLFQASGIQSINLVYSYKLLDPASSQTTDTVIDQAKIQAVATSALSDPSTPVSIDIEVWDQFDTGNTPPLYAQVVNIFKTVNATSPLGFYATVPQNTYGCFPASTAFTYDPLNAAYASVAALVDYYSPSLYNYQGLDESDWQQAATYAIGASRKCDSTKPVYPYITPGVKTNGVITFLTYDQMLSRLVTLQSLGADGCIIWTGSGGVAAGGIYDPTTGWGKAVADFHREYEIGPDRVFGDGYEPQLDGSQ